MSKIRDRVVEEIIQILPPMETDSMEAYAKLEKMAGKILSIPEIAIVDREAELPQNPHNGKWVFLDKSKAEIKQLEANAYTQAQKDMVKTGWVKEVKDG